MRWSEVDDALWTVPASRMKAAREHRVPLSDAAAGLLAQLPRTSDFVFPGKPGCGLSNGAMLAVLRRMDRRDVTPHGFRSCFRDWAAEQTNHPRDVCEAALAHVVKNKTEQAYRRGDLLEKRRALMRDWAAYCGSVTTLGEDGAAARS